MPFILQKNCLFLTCKENLTLTLDYIIYSQSIKWWFNKIIK